VRTGDTTFFRLVEKFASDVSIRCGSCVMEMTAAEP